ncbi:lactosylceramide 1,3-N-acetyl-beta-D-glucosaminyltransferase, partial [Aplysia californica]|uniref:Hexosyltransferase n=1 Tax=Aplysia californica TaxID=6500 RepID=A0ABM1A4N8_APLCA
LFSFTFSTVLRFCRWRPRVLQYGKTLSRRKKFSLVSAASIILILLSPNLLTKKLTEKIEKTEKTEKTNEKVVETELDRSLICPIVKPAHVLPELSTIVEVSPPVSEFLAGPVINSHPHGYVHNHERICEERQARLLFVVPSAPDNFQRRKGMRNSLVMKYVKNDSNSAVLLFFLGLPRFVGRKTVEIQSKINAEQEKYNDIVQLNFTDVYATTVVKMVSILKWESTFCYNADYVIRIDDDIEVNVSDAVAVVFRTGDYYHNFLLGTVNTGWAPIRAKESKYYVSELEYPPLTYPPFALGGLQAYPLQTARLLFEASLRLKTVWLEDVYITALCASKVNATLLADPDFKFVHEATP